MNNQPVLPQYSGANVRGIIPALCAPRSAALPGWMPGPATAPQRVLLVIDGLGWEQLQARRHIAPALCSMLGGPITTVAPSTTATALTSITTGLTPGEHGLVGYRLDIGGDVLNVLRWQGDHGDLRRSHPPRDVQPFLPFMGESPVVITRAELEGSGFTDAHLRGAALRGWRTMSAIAVEIAHQIAAGERLVYAYYDGIDKTAHERGFGDYYDAELAMVDHFVGDVLGRLPADAALVITADHGQVHVGSNVVKLDSSILSLVRLQSGEGRFRWLHAKHGAQADLLAATTEAHGDQAWVVSREQTIDEGWFGPIVAPPVAGRLGDVALAACDDVTFFDPADSGPYELICRHGSLTSAEMYVPLLAAHGRR
ncbi:MAG TPA: alkaline phosphatase family protein [Ilumatobacteraceae bacterium]